MKIYNVNINLKYEQTINNFINICKYFYVNRCFLPFFGRFSVLADVLQKMYELCYTNQTEP